MKKLHAPAKTLPYNSRPEKQELILNLLWLPMHLGVIPVAAGMLYYAGKIDANLANLLVYAMSFIVLLCGNQKLLRRDFDVLCDRLPRILFEIFVTYCAMYCFNLILASLLLALTGTGNPNNETVAQMVETGRGPMVAMTVLMAPVAEELMFRGGVFALLRKFNRVWAYVVTIALFSVYHVWAYAALDWKNFVFVLQYIPITWLICRLYERTDSIWACIFFHMLVNGVSVWAMQLL